MINTTYLKSLRGKQREGFSELIEVLRDAAEEVYLVRVGDEENILDVFCIRIAEKPFEVQLINDTIMYNCRNFVLSFGASYESNRKPFVVYSSKKDGIHEIAIKYGLKIFSKEN